MLLSPPYMPPDDHSDAQRLRQQRQRPYSSMMLCFRKTTGAWSASPFLHIFRKPLSRYLQAPQEVLKMSKTTSVLLLVLCSTSLNS